MVFIIKWSINNIYYYIYDPIIYMGIYDPNNNIIYMTQIWQQKEFNVS